MKKTIFIYSLLLLTGLAVFFLSSQTSLFKFELKKNAFHIALAGPLSGLNKASGKEALRGVRLYIDKINKKGGIYDKKIKLHVFDDSSQLKRALQVAWDISRDKDILLVVGHLDSSTSIAAGRIYKKSWMPAITASATAVVVTEENEWYFRTVPSSASQGSFIANYINKVLKKKSVIIVSLNTIYGSDLAVYFERAASELGIEIKKKWVLQPDIKSMDNELMRVLIELRAVEDAGMIFVAAEPFQSVKILTSLKQGTNYPIIGSDAFASPSFLKGFENYPKERAIPGYYTEGAYGISMFIPDIGSEKAYNFRHEFIKEYGEEPSWIAYCYYDAMHVAAEAIRRSEIQDDGYIQKNRKKIKTALQEMNDQESGARGITADIYFDRKGDADRPLPVGIYRHRNLIPAFSQYQSLSGDIGNVIRDAMADKIIEIDGKLMSKTQVVYTGIDINEISKLNIMESTYTADFYVWFRFQGSFDPSQVEFTNAVKPIKLDLPISERRDEEKDITVQAYHIKADFRSNFDFCAYPFEYLDLRIQLRHKSRIRNSLIFTQDILGMRKFSKAKEVERHEIITVPGWEAKYIEFYQDIISEATKSVSPDVLEAPASLAYSQFNGAVYIGRKDNNAALRSFLPIMEMLIFLYLIYFIPYEHHGIRIAIITGILITNRHYHLTFLAGLPVGHVTTLFEYAYLSVYVLLALSAVMSVLAFILHRKGSEKKIKTIFYAGKIIYPSIVLAAAFLIVYLKNTLSGL